MLQIMILHNFCSVEWKAGACTFTVSIPYKYTLHSALVLIAGNTMINVIQHEKIGLTYEHKIHPFTLFCLSHLLSFLHSPLFGVPVGKNL